MAGAVGRTGAPCGLMAWTVKGAANRSAGIAKSGTAPLAGGRSSPNAGRLAGGAGGRGMATLAA